MHIALIVYYNHFYGQSEGGPGRARRQRRGRRAHSRWGVLVAIAARSLGDVADEVTMTQDRTLVVLASRGPRSLEAIPAEQQGVPVDAFGFLPRRPARLPSRAGRPGGTSR